MVLIRSHQRAIEYAVPAARALQLREEGFSLAEIREKLKAKVSLPTISRAVARGIEERRASQ
jgi:DNA-binding transcriptional MerR regulator